MDVSEFFRIVRLYIQAGMDFLTEYGVFTLFNISFSFYDILIFLLIGGAVCYVISTLFGQ